MRQGPRRDKRHRAALVLFCDGPQVFKFSHFALKNIAFYVPSSIAMNPSTMDHEKPQAVFPQVYDFSNEPRSVPSPVTPDIDFLRGTPSIEEAVNVEGRRERRGESLW